MVKICMRTFDLIKRPLSLSSYFQRLEEEKKTLELKLSELKDTLSSATHQIESMASDHFALKSQLEQSSSIIKTLQEEKTILSIKENELLADKQRHDTYLENLKNAVDVRVSLWKKMMSDKDSEIERLNAKIATLMQNLSHTSPSQLDSERSKIAILDKKLVEREHQIALLNEQLFQATEEIESNTKIIQSLQEKLTYSQDPKKAENFIKNLQSSIKKLEEKLHLKEEHLKEVEKEAEDRSKQMTILMARMTSYENSQYGLPEAVAEIKDLKNQLKIRDKQIESWTQEINVLQMNVQDLQEENEMLRDKMGVGLHTDLSKETKRYVKTRKNELQALRSKVAQLEEEIVNLKTRNYSLKKQLNYYDQQIGGNGPPLGVVAVYERTDIRDAPDGGSGSVAASLSTNQGDPYTLVRKGEEWKEKYEIILEENSALRRGLHEILECMNKMTGIGFSHISWIFKISKIFFKYFF